MKKWLVFLFIFLLALSFTFVNIPQGQAAQNINTDYSTDSGYGFALWKVGFPSAKGVTYYRDVVNCTGDWFETDVNKTIDEFFRRYVVPLNVRVFILYECSGAGLPEGWFTNLAYSSTVDYMFQKADDYNVSVFLMLPYIKSGSNTYRQYYGSTYPDHVAMNGTGQPAISNNQYTPDFLANDTFYENLVIQQVQNYTSLYGHHKSFVGVYYDGEYAQWALSPAPSDPLGLSWGIFSNQTLDNWANDGNYFTHHTNCPVEEMFVNRTAVYDTLTLFYDINSTHREEYWKWRAWATGQFLKNVTDYFRQNYRFDFQCILGMTYMSRAVGNITQSFPECMFEFTHYNGDEIFGQRGMSSTLHTYGGASIYDKSLLIGFDRLWGPQSNQIVNESAFVRTFNLISTPQNPRYQILRWDNYPGTYTFNVSGWQYYWIRNLTRILLDTPYYNETVCYYRGYSESPYYIVSSSATSNITIADPKTDGPFGFITANKTAQRGAVVLCNYKYWDTKWVYFSFSPSADMNITGTYLVMSTDGYYWNITSASTFSLNTTLAPGETRTYIVKQLSDKAYHFNGQILSAQYSANEIAFNVTGRKDTTYTLFTECSTLPAEVRINGSRALRYSTPEELFVNQSISYLDREGWWYNDTGKYLLIHVTTSGPITITISLGKAPELIIEPIAVGVTVAAASAASVALYRYLRRRR